MYRGPLNLLATCAIVVAALVACSSGGTGSSSRPAAPTPTVDPAVHNYEILVNGYWDDHVSVSASAVIVCLGTGAGTQGVNPPACGQHARAMLAVQEKFASDLIATTAPAEFADEDQAFRTQLPKTIVDLKAMISAADAGDKQSVQNRSIAFVDDMGPVLAALDKINPSIQHG